jgi:hypothetical protein
MSHLRTEPDLYREGETYVACRWDFGDIREKVNEILENNERSRQIAFAAKDVARRYLLEAGPVLTYGSLLLPKLE